MLRAEPSIGSKTRLGSFAITGQLSLNCAKNLFHIIGTLFWKFLNIFVCVNNEETSNKVFFHSFFFFLSSSVLFICLTMLNCANLFTLLSSLAFLSVSKVIAMSKMPQHGLCLQERRQLLPVLRQALEGHPEASQHPQEEKEKSFIYKKSN